MKIKLIRNFCIFCVSVFAFIAVATFSGFAQSNNISIGNQTFGYGFQSTPLNYTMGGIGGLSSLSFVGNVGGVAFEAESTPETNLNNSQVSISYDRTQPDGHRLIISINQNTYKPFIPDWKLIPIANYANSRYNAIVSLFGPQTDFQYYHITYHPAFNNTLLGLRLLQADIMFINLDNFWRLPVLNGNVILGYGESIQNQHTWINFASELEQAFGNERFQSWVLVDYGLQISMLIDNNEFKLTNSPYYYFWKRDGDKAVPVSGLIDRMKSSISAIRNYNPVVFNAATDTMRYAAFFRYLKRTNINSWNNFLQQISNVQIQPEVNTPTQWKKPLFSSLDPNSQKTISQKPFISLNLNVESKFDK